MCINDWSTFLANQLAVDNATCMNCTTTKHWAKYMYMFLIKIFELLPFRRLMYTIFALAYSFLIFFSKWRYYIYLTNIVLCQFKKKKLFNNVFLILMLGQSKMKSKLILFNPINVKPLENLAFTIHHFNIMYMY